MNPARLVCQLAEDAGQPRHQRVDDHLPSQPFGLQHRLPGRVDCSGGQGLTPGGCRRGVCKPPWHRLPAAAEKSVSCLKKQLEELSSTIDFQETMEEEEEDSQGVEKTTMLLDKQINSRGWEEL